MPSATYKVIILGNSAVGKSTLIARLTTGEFKLNTTTTIGLDVANFKVTLDNGLEVELQIWDTAGQERFRNISKPYFRGAHGVIYVYDVTNVTSFQDVGYWLQSVEDVLGQPRPGDISPVGILVGNKSDMADSKVVTKAQGENLKDRHSLYGFYEVSAKSGDNVEKAFKQLAYYLVDNFNSSWMQNPQAAQSAAPEKKASNPFYKDQSMDATVKLGAAQPNEQTNNSSDCKC